MKPGLIRQVINKTRKNEINSVEEYVDKLIYAKLPRSEKLKIGKQFVKQTGISRAEITRARNRHPYYKKLKNANINARLKKRNSRFSGVHKRWTEKELRLFILLTPDLTDSELSEQFERSIPSVNAIRRKLKIIERINNPDKNIIGLLNKNESELKRILENERTKNIETMDRQ